MKPTYEDLFTAVAAVRPLLVAHFGAHAAMRDQLRRGVVPVPLPAYEGEDQHTIDVIERLTELLRWKD